MTISAQLMRSTKTTISTAPRQAMRLGLQQMMGAVISATRKWHARQAEQAYLEGLSDHELDNLGLRRSRRRNEQD
jgi:uncharacterized protein YjiS (DUF1127 family)